MIPIITLVTITFITLSPYPIETQSQILRNQVPEGYPFFTYRHPASNNIHQQFSQYQSSNSFQQPSIESNPHYQANTLQTNQLLLSDGKVIGGLSFKNGSYILQWEVNYPYVTFKVRRLGIGFFGFGISPSGGMSGSDIFIGGVGPNGMPYANDYHHEYQPGGIGSAVPDIKNDYEVIEISESQGLTTGTFRRVLDTGDALQDHAILNMEQYILWCVGPNSRNLEYHGPSNRGVVKINLLNPPQKFRLRRSIL